VPTECCRKPSPVNQRRPPKEDVCRNHRTGGSAVPLPATLHQREHLRPSFSQRSRRRLGKFRKHRPSYDGTLLWHERHQSLGILQPIGTRNRIVIEECNPFTVRLRNPLIASKGNPGLIYAHQFNRRQAANQSLQSPSLFIARAAIYYLHFGGTIVQLGKQCRQAITDVISPIVRADHNGQIISASSR
jgi:hypothetical protein